MFNFKKIKSTILSGMLAAASVAGSFTAVTPSLNVSAANDDYAKLLQYSLYFYDANMCGDKVGSTSAITWRGDCHTSDEVPGGFHDAGDHVMFGLPQGYTASSLGWSYYEFKDAYDATGQGEHLKVITDYFCDFFKRSTKLSGDSVSNFLYQKGDGDVDHGYWGAPEQQGGGRKMFWTSNGASDIAADYAAALALNYINFGNAEDLKYAEALYKFSTQYNQVATEGTIGFYKSSGCQDEQANAAGWLYLATKNESYKNDCASKQTQYLGWADGWDNRGLGAACVYAHITGDWGKVNNYLAGQCSGGGYLCMDDWGSARLNCSMQFAALAASKNSNAGLTSWCQGQMDYILGNNPFNTCLVTGYASNSAKNTHHRAASGYQGYEGSDGMNQYTTTYHPTKGHVLIGALAGGPNKAGQYSDVMNDYMCNEVAIDYNAGLVGAAAGLYSMYKTGSTSTSIEGVSKIYNSTVTPGPSQTTAPPSTNQPTVTTTVGGNTGNTGDDIVLTPTDMEVGTEVGDDGEMNNYAEFAPRGAKSATLYFTVNSNDTKASGAFGTWTGVWTQEDFDAAVPASKEVAVDYTIPATVGNTVKAMIFWPHGDGVTINKVVLHFGNSSSSSTPTPQVTTAPPATNPPTTTKEPSGNTGSDSDIVLTPSDMVVGTEEGDDGEMNNYAEFAPRGAKSATLYYKVNSNDTNSSGAFGTWTGVWSQEDFDAAVPASKEVSVDYTIPATVGNTVKAMIFWPHGDAVTIEKVVLHFDGSSAATTTKAPETQTPPTTTTPTPSGNVKYGDANCDGIVSIADATAILQHLGNKDKYALTAQGEKNADVDATPGVTANDAIVIQQVDAGLIKESALPLR